ncbi:MAG: DUF2934 domain-containing protein [Myxococcota bacterium]
MTYLIIEILFFLLLAAVLGYLLGSSWRLRASTGPSEAVDFEQREAQLNRRADELNQRCQNLESGLAEALREKERAVQDATKVAAQHRADLERIEKARKAELQDVASDRDAARAHAEKLMVDMTELRSSLEALQASKTPGSSVAPAAADPDLQRSVDALSAKLTEREQALSDLRRAVEERDLRLAQLEKDLAGAQAEARDQLTDARRQRADLESDLAFRNLFLEQARREASSLRLKLQETQAQLESGQRASSWTPTIPVSSPPVPPMRKPLDDDIRARAYRIWMDEGRPPDRSYEHWLRAEAEIRQELQAQSATISELRVS